MTKFKTGIVLSGGAMRGIAHLGVLKALQEMDVKIEVIAGTSIGAIIGAFYAQGYDPEEIYQFYNDKNPFQYLRPQFPDIGLLKADKLFKDFKRYFESCKFEDLNIPLFVTTTNLNSGRQSVFNSGDLFPVLKAASSVPVIFKPEEIAGEKHSDGGVISNLPIEPLIDQCEFLIGVNVNPIGQDDQLSSINSILMRTLHLSIWGNTNKNINELDLYIEPQKLKNYSVIDHQHMKEIFQAGFHEGKEIINRSKLLES